MKDYNVTLTDHEVDLIKRAIGTRMDFLDIYGKGRDSQDEYDTLECLLHWLIGLSMDEVKA